MRLSPPDTPPRSPIATILHGEFRKPVAEMNDERDDGGANAIENNGNRLKVASSSPASRQLPAPGPPWKSTKMPTSNEERPSGETSSYALSSA